MKHRPLLERDFYIDRRAAAAAKTKTKKRAKRKENIKQGSMVPSDPLKPLFSS